MFAKLSAAIVLAPFARAQTSPDISIEQLRRAQERELLQRKKLEIERDLYSPPMPETLPVLLPKDESPCFAISMVELNASHHHQFEWLLAHSDGHAHLSKPDPIQGRCLGVQGIQTVVDRLQNALIQRGYITSRVLAGQQNLQSGTLTLDLVLGYVGEIRWAEGTGQRASRWNTVPANNGDVLNLRNIEQALENYKRVPSAEADIQIVPGTKPGNSDLVIAHQQPMPFRLSVTADDSGTSSTGKYQGTLTFSYDNWLNLSDLFYVTVLNDLGGADPGQRGTNGHIAHYSVPFGYWLVGFTKSSNRYHQTVAGASQDYLYSGKSSNVEAQLSHVVYRDAVSKSIISVKGFQRSSNNYIDDTEVEVQRRVVSGLEWGLNQRASWGTGSVDVYVNYRRGTGAWGSLPAPEEAFGEGTSRMKLWLLGATVQQSFTAGMQRLQYTGAWRAQQNKTPLTPQDRFAIGGRFTVRGFDGLSVLSAERGWLIRNDIAAPITTQIQAYVGVDTGHVAGPSAAQLAGQNLTGGAVGLRGQWARVQYEVFIGKPLRKNESFKTSNSTAGFSLSMSM